MGAINMTPEAAKRRVALLGKMLLYSIDHLTQEEHHIYDTLVEDLAGVANSAKEGVTTPSPLPPTGKKHAEPTPTPPRTTVQDYRSLPQNKKLQGARPEIVVRSFIECWGKQDFKLEYFCLSNNFQQGKRAQQSLDEYVNARYERFANRHLTGPLSKQVVDISAPVVEGDLASVQVAERHTGKDEDMILYRTYKLVFEDTAWRIQNFVTNQKRARKRI